MKAQIVCQSCGWSVYGDLPDTEYSEQIGGKLARAVQKHHYDTGTPGGVLGDNMFGHRDFDALLWDGQKGEIVGNSYSVYYSPPKMIAWREREQW